MLRLKLPYMQVEKKQILGDVKATIKGNDVEDSEASEARRSKDKRHM